MPGAAPGPAGAAPADVERLVGRFPSVDPPTSDAGAAVTIVLRSGRTEVETLLIQRTRNPRDPASGQVALPGGHVDPTDSSLRATAIRELREEVGLGADGLRGTPRFVGLAPAPRFRLTVGVFTAQIGRTAPEVASTAEVARVFWLPRSALARTEHVPRTTSQGKVAVNATVFEGHVLWGFTRRVVRDFFGLPAEDIVARPLFSAAGDPEPAEPRTVSDP